MKRIPQIPVLLASAIVLVITGCSTCDTVSLVPVNTSKQPYVMARLDTVHITNRGGGVEELNIQQDGKIELPAGSKFVEGMSLDDFCSLVSRSYPEARSIEIIEFRPNRVTVLGEVFHQIHTDLSDGPMRVMDAIAAANGFTPLANKRRVRLVRQNAGTVTVYELDLRAMMNGKNLNQNLLLQPGDVITVPRNFL